MEDDDITPPAAEVYGEPDDHGNPVHVTVTNRVRNEPLPAGSFLGRTVVMQTGSVIRKLAGADPKRRRVTLTMRPLGSGVDGVLVANSRAQLDSDTPQGFLIQSPNAIIRWPFETSDELWGMGVLISSTTGTFAAFIDSTDDALVSVALEQWTG